MDSRLFRLDGSRPSRLRTDDLPAFARSLVALIRKRATVGVYAVDNVDLVTIRGGETNFTVLNSDWVKVFPSFASGAFDPVLTPASSYNGYSDPSIAYGESVLDHADRLLYNRVFGVLTGLFTESFPTQPY